MRSQISCDLAMAHLQAGLLAGAFEVDITPPLDVPLGSGFNPPPVTGIADPLRARALVVSDGSTRVALACADILAVDPQLSGDVRRFVQERTGLAPAQVMVCATHTHTCGGRLQPSRGNGDPALMEILARQIAGAIAAAAERLRPARLAAGSTIVDGVSVNRRDPAVSIDRLLRVLRVESAGSESHGLIAALTVFACHPTLVSRDRPALSADFPGALAATVRNAFGPSVVVLPANGACGDVNPIACGTDGLEAARRIGQILGGETIALLAGLAHRGGAPCGENTRAGVALPVPLPAPALGRPPVRAVTATVRVPYKRFRAAEDADAEAAETSRHLLAAGVAPERVCAWQAGRSVPAQDTPAPGSDVSRLVARLLRLRSEAWAARVAVHQGIVGRAYREIELQAFVFGPEIALLAVPFELFNSIGREIAAESPFPRLFLIGCANDLGGYLMPDEEHAREGFEAGITFYGPGAAGVVRTAALNLLREAGAETPLAP